MSAYKDDHGEGRSCDEEVFDGVVQDGYSFTSAQLAEFHPSTFDANIPPFDNFYGWKNSQWLDDHPIPPENSRFSTFIELQQTNMMRFKTLLDQLETKPYEFQTDDERVLRDFYLSCLDEQKIEEAGLEPILHILAMCNDTSVSIRVFYRKFIN